MLFVCNKNKIIVALISSGLNMPEYDVKQQNSQNTRSLTEVNSLLFFFKTIFKEKKIELYFARII